MYKFTNGILWRKERRDYMAPCPGAQEGFLPVQSPPTPTLVTKDWWGQEEELQSRVQGLLGRAGPEAGQKDTGNLGGTSRKKSPAPDI